MAYAQPPCFFKYDKVVKYLMSAGLFSRTVIIAQPTSVSHNLIHHRQQRFGQLANLLLDIFRDEWRRAAAVCVQIGEYLVQYLRSC